jgi:hypothetical protein
MKESFLASLLLFFLIILFSKWLVLSQNNQSHSIVKSFKMFLLVVFLSVVFSEKVFLRSLDLKISLLRLDYHL